MPPQNVAWTRSNVETNTSAYWQQMACTFSQLQGLSDGYAASGHTCTPALSFDDILIVNAQVTGGVSDVACPCGPSRPLVLKTGVISPRTRTHTHTHAHTVLLDVSAPNVLH